MPQPPAPHPSRRKQVAFFGVLAAATALIGVLTVYKLSVANTYRIFAPPATASSTAQAKGHPTAPANFTPIGTGPEPGDPAQALVAVDAAGLVRGQHLVNDVLACKSCHGADFGGRVLQDDAQVVVCAPNLTVPRSDGRWQWALRDGVDGERRGLWRMPTRAHSALTEADRAAVVAAVRAVPPVHTSLPQPRLHWRGHVAAALRQLRLLRTDSDRVQAAFVQEGIDADASGATAGAYLYAIANCGACHAPNTLEAAGDAGDAIKFAQALTTAHVQLAQAPREVAGPPGGFGRLTNVERLNLWRYLQKQKQKLKQKR